MLEMYDLLAKHASDERQLSSDPVKQAAAQRWIEVLGEAASHVSEELKLTYPEVVWREIIGVRVILAHGYFHVERDIIGNIVSRAVPILRAQLQEILLALPDVDD